MKRPLDEVVAQGLVGGVLAGLVVALWFFVVDVVAGEPLRTPALLGYFLFQRETLAATPAVVIFYSILHLGVFAVLGVTVASGLELLGSAPGLLKGAVFGILVLDLVFYGALLLTGARIFGVLSWPHVLASNIVAGMTLMTYLHVAGRDERPLGIAVLRGHPVLTEGLITGCVGAAAVALWFLGLDLAAGEPFRTPAALGAAMFLGARGAADVTVGVGIVAGYTAVHVAVFGVVGILFASLVRQVERTPQFVLLVGMGAIVLAAIAVPGMALTAEWVLGTVGAWAVVAANVLAVLAMGWWLWRLHPGLRRRLLEEPLDVRT